MSINKLFNFINNSPTCFHVVNNIIAELKENNYSELKESQRFCLKPNQGYYVTRNDSSIIAFYIPERRCPVFIIVASHSDSPSFKVKKNPEMKVDDYYIKLNTEPYGGMLVSNWLDRPLSIAGRVIISMNGDPVSIPINIDKDLLMIPNLAIHMNRNANDGYKYDMQKDMLPLMSCGIEESAFSKMIADAAGVPVDNILGTDLFVYNRENCRIWGANEEFISGPRLDDQECVYASLQGFIANDTSDRIKVLAVFDNEEVGSGSFQGAGSTFLYDILSRINLAMDGDAEDFYINIAESFLISADNSHALHPNHTEACDPTNHPLINKGVVLKSAANQKYCTDGVSAAIFTELCKTAGVSMQSFFNKSGTPGGSTLGNISIGQVSIRSVDMGLPQLAMHSAYETAGVKDYIDAVKLFTCYYE